MNWIKQGAVLVPSLPWHHNTIYEPDPIVIDGELCLLYGAGWSSSALALARNPSGDGRTFIPDTSPIAGQGANGIAGNLARVGSIQNQDETWDIYTGGTDGNLLRLKFSPDFANLICADPVVIFSYESNLPRWKANTSVIQDGDTRHLFFDEAIEVPLGNIVSYRIALATSKGDVLFTRDVRGHIPSLQVGTGLIGAPDVHKVGSKWHMWTLGTESPGSLLSVHLYHHSSEDLRNWTIQNGGAPVLAMTDELHADQIGDPAVFEWGGKSLLYYDGVANTATPYSAIYLAEIDAPLESFCP